MRFTENGPSLPNNLLNARDVGEVVFFCGAGISIPAGLPDFFRLTVEVAGRLGALPTSRPGQLIETERQYRDGRATGGHREPVAFDRVFSQLAREFGVAQVEAEVVAALSAVRRPRLDHHRALLDLARGPDGRQRLVTTNFDPLFNRAQPRLRRYAPPHFPDLTRRDGFDGVVHLHGMLPTGTRRATSDPLGLVLSSADFGRAYLADAWATRFVCDLLSRHIVVLLGYSADDPPMRYLLEGLSVAGRIGDHRLFAFAAGDPAVVEAEWRERGVTAIAYDPVNHHQHLWETIHGWAARARDPAVWRGRIATLAQTAPQELKPFERGQVAALCSSAEGAEVFANAVPSPPAEWLCVLDSRCRYWKPGITIRYDAQRESEIDPLTVYGLDDDPPRPPTGTREQEPPGLDFLAPLKTDDPVAHESGMIAGWRWPGAPLNKRLFQLSRWVESIMTSPTTAWWAASRPPLHTHLRDRFAWRLDRPDIVIDPVLRKAWRLLLEAQDTTPDSVRDDWYGVADMVQAEGWVGSALRAFARATQPRIEAKRNFHYAPVPPEAGPVELARIARFNVLYPTLMENNVAVPDDQLPAVLAIIRGHLELGAALETEIGHYPGRLPTLHPENKPGEHHNSDDENFYVTFANLFQRLAAFDPAAAQREYRHWDRTNRFFIPLRIWAQGNAALVPPAEVGRTLRELSRGAFWDMNYSRELLWTLKARWKHLSTRDRLALERRIIEGRERYQLEEEVEYVQYRSSLSAQRLMWMRDQGLRLSAAALAQVPRLKKANPRWRDRWAKSADESHESRVDWVETKTDPTPITNLPVSQVIARCEALEQRDFGSFTQQDPFRGLVQVALQRAMAVLNYEARHKRYPQRYWSRLLSDWPKEATKARAVLLAKTLAKLPAEALVAIRYDLGRWVQAHYEVLERTDRKVAQACLDHIVSALEAGGEEALRSALGKASVGGVEIPSNRMGTDYAINSPTGELAQGLIDALFARKPKHNQRLPQDLRSRLERLLALSGEGGWHALTVIAAQLNGLYYFDRAWTRAHLLPRFDPADVAAEAAWSGFLRARQLATPNLFREMKAAFLCAIAATPRWKAHGLSHLGEHLLLALEGPPKGKPLVTAQEGRTALRSASSELRQQVLWFLRTRAQKAGWYRVVVPFFRSVWPRERQFQTADTTRALVLFLEELDDKFPAGLKLVADFLVALPETDTFMFQLSSKGERGHADLTNRYPQDTLLLVDKIVDDGVKRPPYGLADVLTRIADTAPELRHDARWQRLHRLAL
jgi:hypothetical protein